MGLIYGYRNTYVPFTPMLFNNEKNGFEQIRVGDNFYGNLHIVLNFSRIDFKVHKNSGGVLVKRYIALDKELTHNFTKKALDPTWIKEHR